VVSGQHLYSVSGPADAAGTGYGSSVAIGERLLAIGAPYELQGDSQGVVHVHAAANGAPAFELVGHPARTTHRFGASLSLSCAGLAVGDPQDSEAALYSGAAYAFAIPRCP
jgi:hypothetical protein